MAQSVKDRTVKGISWSAIDSIASQGITFIVGIILARLLSPNEFGTLGVAMIFVALFNKIVDCGFSNALIRKQDAENIDYDTTFIFNLILSFVLYGITYFIAPFIAIFFHNEILTSVVRWISLVLIINAFAIIQRTKLVKAINFKTQAKISLFASLISGCIGIALAYAGMGVWSLVGQQLSRQLINTLLLWIFSSWHPRMQFSFQSFKNLFSYGGKLMLSGIIDTFFNELTTIMVGRMYTPATLGQYSRAKQFSSVFSSNLSGVIERVTYPVLSEFQSDNVQLIAYYKKLIRVLMLITGIGTAIIASCAKSIILILVGEKWIEAILYLQLLAFVEITIPIKHLNVNLLQVYGRSDYILGLSIIKRVIELGALALGLIDIKWMLIGYTCAGVIGLLLNAWCTEKVSGYQVLSQIKDLIPSLSVALVIGLLMFTIGGVINNIYLALICQIGVGVAMYILCSKVFDLPEMTFVKNLMKEYLGKFSKRF